MRTISRYINLRKWFPPNDPVAAKVARLCILKEDFEMEIKGLLSKTILQLDSNGYEYRKIYFLRNLFRTLLEIGSTVHSLKSDNRFTREISKQPEPLRKAFEDLEEKITSAHKLIKEYRNWIGGHVNQKRIEDALKQMGSSRAGFFEIDEYRGTLRLKFVAELCTSIMFDHVPADDQLKKAEEIISILERIAPNKAIDAVLTTYMDSRSLLK